MGMRLDEPRGRRSVARHADRHPQGDRVPWSTDWVAELTGASFRQCDHWIRTGVLGKHLEGRGSGSRRRFSPGDVEAVHALAALASVGCREEWLGRAVAAVRAGRVDPAGERLVLLLDGTCYRHPIGEYSRAVGPGWMVPLTPCPDVFVDDRGTSMAPSPLAAEEPDRGDIPAALPRSSAPGRVA